MWSTVTIDQPVKWWRAVIFLFFICFVGNPVIFFCCSSLIHVCHLQSSKYSFSYLQIVKSAQQDKTKHDKTIWIIHIYISKLNIYTYMYEVSATPTTIANKIEGGRKRRKNAFKSKRCLSLSMYNTNDTRSIKYWKRVVISMTDYMMRIKSISFIANAF